MIGLDALTDLGVRLPVLAAPMAGGASTTQLVSAAADVGSLGFLAGGYKTPQEVADEIAAMRSLGRPFGVNLFAPNPVPISVDAFRQYAWLIQSEADPYGISLPGSEPIEDDDRWTEKIDLLLAQPVPVVSFTFGFPDRDVIRRLQAAGSVVVLTVTSADEARLASELMPDALAVQGSAAGGHSGTLTPDRAPAPISTADLVGRVRAAVPLPIIAAGGLSTAADVTAVLSAGAQAAMVGTALLRTGESGASATYKDALGARSDVETVVTRAFTGRPARALRNQFTERYSAKAPLGYPALHHLTSPLRRAAVAYDNPELLHLWAGAGHRHARVAPVAEVLTELAA